jgi:hypothetical protein
MAATLDTRVSLQGDELFKEYGSTSLEWRARIPFLEQRRIRTNCQGKRVVLWKRGKHEVAGVDGAIHFKDGREILKACREIQRTPFPNGLPTGEAILTAAKISATLGR